MAVTLITIGIIIILSVCSAISDGKRRKTVQKNSSIIKNAGKDNLSNNYVSKLDLGDGLFRVEQTRSHFGIFDSNINRFVIPCQYYNIMYYKPMGLFFLEPHSDRLNPHPHVFAVNRNNDIVIPPLYDEINIIQRQYIEVVKYDLTRKSRMCGIVGIDGNVIVEPQYLAVWSSDGKHMVANQTGRCGQVNSNGYSQLEYDAYQAVIPSDLDTSICIFPNYSTQISDLPYAERFDSSPKYLIVSKNGQMGVVDMKNEIIIPFANQVIEIVEGAYDYAEFYKIKKDNLFGIYSLQGDVIISPRYSKITVHHEGMENVSPHFSLNGSIYSDMKADAEYNQMLYGKPAYFEVDTTDGEKYYFDQNGRPYTKKQNIYISFSAKEHPATYHKTSDAIPASRPTNKTSYLFFDTETTGLPSNFNAPSSDINNWPRLVQLSWILTDYQGNHINTGDYIIRPVGYSIPIDASKVHGITTNRALLEGEEICNVLDAFINDLNKASIIVGHNIEFDKKIVGAELIRLGYDDYLYKKKSICTMKSSIDFCAIPGKFGFKYPTLQELYFKLFNDKFEDAHNSACDIAATEKCFWEMRNRQLI